MSDEYERILAPGRNKRPSPHASIWNIGNDGQQAVLESFGKGLREHLGKYCNVLPRGFNTSEICGEPLRSPTGREVLELFVLIGESP